MVVFLATGVGGTHVWDREENGVRCQPATIDVRPDMSNCYYSFPPKPNTNPLAVLKFSFSIYRGNILHSRWGDLVPPGASKALFSWHWESMPFLWIPLTHSEESKWALHG